MNKRFIAIAMASLLAVGGLAGCNNNQSSPTSNPSTPSGRSTDAGNENGNESNQTEDKYEKELTIKMARRGDVRVVEEDIYTPFIKDKFNMIFDVTDINNSDFVTRMNLSFASGEQPDINLSQRPEYMLGEWIEAGYLRGYTEDDLRSLVPNFVNQYTEAEWDVVWRSIRHSDNKAYYLPSRRAASMNMAWMYRKDTFDALGVDFPETTDELIDIMRKIKTDTGRYPFVAASSDNVFWAFTGFLQAFGLPELAPRDLSYIDPRTGQFEPYVFTTDAFREHTSFMNQLYKEGLIWPEFATGTNDQVNAMKSQGHGYITWGYPDKVDTDYNRLSQNADPNATWDWAKVMLTQDPSEGFFFKADPYFNADGVSISADADDEVVERYLDYFNWIHGEEGMVLRTYGVEGVTYTKEGNNYVFMDHMTSPDKSEGKTLGNYGLISMGMQHPNLNNYYRPYLTELSNTFMNRENYYFHLAPVISFTPEESSQLADIATSLNQTGQEYYARFILGHMDVNDDVEWKKYLDTMERLGLSRFKEIRITAYERTNQ